MLNMKRLPHKLFETFVLVGIFTSGFVFGFIFKFPFFTISREIEIMDIVSIAVTILALYFVSKVLDKSKDEKRMEKDLIIKRTEEYYDNLVEFKKKVSQNNLIYQDVAMQCKNMKIGINLLVSLMGVGKINVSTVKIGIIQKLIKKVLQLLTLRTNVVNSVIILTTSELRIIDMEIEKLKNLILNLEFDIIRD